MSLSRPLMGFHVNMATDKKLDKLINQAWGMYASGIQVSIMDMGKIFAEIKTLISPGRSLEDIIVNVVVPKYRKN